LTKIRAQTDTAAGVAWHAFGTVHLPTPPPQFAAEAPFVINGVGCLLRAIDGAGELLIMAGCLPIDRSATEERRA
jgi:hypothetical protein